MSVRKCLSHKKEKTIMSRSVLVMAASLIVSGFPQAQETAMGQERTHEVARGETLWAIAQRYLGNPFRWPLIMEANQPGLRNPHLVLPGQILVIPALPGEPARVQDLTVAVEGQVRTPDPAVAPEGARVQVLTSPAGAWPCPGPEHRTIFFGGPEGDRGCAVTSPSASERTAFYSGLLGQGTVQPMGEPTAGPGFDPVTVESTALSSVPLGLVYAAEWLEDLATEPESVGIVAAFAQARSDRPLRDRALMFEKLEILPSAGSRLQVGDVLQSFEVLRTLEGLGKVMRPTGILTVTSVEEGVLVAMVSAEFHRLRLGSMVRRAPGYTPRPGARAAPVESNVRGVLLGFPEDRPIRGFGAAAFLDVGEPEGVVVGDEFGAYPGAAGDQSDVETARLRVVLVHGTTSTARVISVTEPLLSTGTPVRLVGKIW